MPIYEYQCQACGERHDALQKFSEGALRKCPACGRLKLKKLISAAAFHLKGTGWYVTDFRDKDKPKSKDEATSDGGGETKTDSGGETKTDGKPAEKKTEAKTESKTKTADKSKSSKSA